MSVKGYICHRKIKKKKRSPKAKSLQTRKINTNSLHGRSFCDEELKSDILLVTVGDIAFL